MSIKTNDLEKLKQKVITVLKQYNVTKAGIFGSYARGDYKKGSDVDILVEIDDSIDLIDFIRLKNLLEKALKRKVDLIEYGLIRKELRKTILKEEVPILR